MITIFIPKFVLNFNRKTLPTPRPPAARPRLVFIPRGFSYLNNYLSGENIFRFWGIWNLNFCVMLDEHISSKYLATLSYNFSIKVIFIFAFIGNRMDLFYFHTKNDEKQQSEEENRNPPLNGCFLVLSASTKQKIKPINVMGISRRFAFIPSPSSLSHFAMSLRFLSFTRSLLSFFFGGEKGVARVEEFVCLLLSSDSFCGRNGSNAESAFTVSPPKWHYYVNDNGFYISVWTSDVNRKQKRG